MDAELAGRRTQAQSQPRTRKGKCHLRYFIRHCLEVLDVLGREQQARDVMCEECVGNATSVKGDGRTATEKMLEAPATPH